MHAYKHTYMHTKINTCMHKYMHTCLCSESGCCELRHGLCALPWKHGTNHSLIQQSPIGLHYHGNVIRRRMLVPGVSKVAECCLTPAEASCA